FYLNSRLTTTDNTHISAFAMYSTLKYEPFPAAGISTTVPAPPVLIANETDSSLDCRILYNQALSDGGVRWNTALESNNGVVPQQEFTYIKTDAGQGVYTWNDYNNNGIQELEEFEVAQFQDQAEYIRVLLPNQIFLKIRQNKFSQILT